MIYLRRFVTFCKIVPYINSLTYLQGIKPVQKVEWHVPILTSIPYGASGGGYKGGGAGEASKRSAAPTAPLPKNEIFGKL